MILNTALFRLFSEKLREENRVIGICYAGEAKRGTPKREIVLEMEVDDREYDRLMQKTCEKKKGFGR